MNCENIFCIYELNGKCVLDNIELDIVGQCKECIYLSLSEKELKKLKKQKSET